MNSVTTRLARAHDVETIVELWKELMDFHQARDRHFTRSPNGPSVFADFVTEQLHNDDALVLVAEEAGAIVGYCLAVSETHALVFEKPRHAEIIDLFVCQSYRRRGIGERLVREVEQWFSRRGFDRIEARIATRNEVSTEFWCRIGYESYLERMFKQLGDRANGGSG